jgi:hypothetical protein
MAAGKRALRLPALRERGKGPVMTGPENPAAAGLGRLRAGHADREQVIEMLKNAFVHGRLTRDELDARAGRRLPRGLAPSWPRSPPTSRTAQSGR